MEKNCGNCKHLKADPMILIQIRLGIYDKPTIECGCERLPYAVDRWKKETTLDHACGSNYEPR